MKRRHVITGFMGLAASAMVTRFGGSHEQIGSDSHEQVLTGVVKRNSSGIPDIDPPALDPASDRERPMALSAVAEMDNRDSQTMSVPTSSVINPNTAVNPVKRKVNKSVDFARDYDDDVFVVESDLPVLHSVFLRLKNLQKNIGFGNFNLVSFDEAIRFGQRFSAVGEFTVAEKDFIEKLFFTDAGDYGFYGQKVTKALTSGHKKSESIKIPYSGHYLLKNESLAYYQKLQKDVGEGIILTSGIRSNVKQLYLFIAKTVRVNGNLSRASRSLAPPGYSYHGIGDFDVGKVGWGAKNFSDDFASTNEYQRMQDLGYIAIRYDHGNQLGVRFEPWHIKVV